ncbi:MAG: hypothetical protein JST85_14485 [Acidobacteria bacterium]|nr:hypothetical protein [Acidobacteriota bacterium]
MLKITEQGDESSLTFKLAGRLAGEWTSELERCWRNAVSLLQPNLIRVELAEVTYVDDAGKQLLTQMARAGAALVAADVVMKALVEQIALHLKRSEFTLQREE